ncbi:MAG: hypothetical protein LBK61_11000 [Spirochaetaceae bacterium]|jgi:hypothetical protein|nr:hypothetical protein [Spirochaetaceae bacterium]
MLFYKKLLFFTGLLLLSMYAFAQNNIYNDINRGIFYLGKPVPNDFKELDGTLGTYTNLLLLESNLRGMRWYFEDGIAGDHIWSLFVKDGIVIASTFYHFFENIQSAPTLVADYKHFFEDQQWIPSDKKQPDDTFAFLKKNDIDILCKGPFELSSEYNFLIIAFTNEEARKKFGQIPE